MEWKTPHRNAATQDRRAMLIVVSMVATLLLAPGHARGQDESTAAEQRIELAEQSQPWLMEWGFRAGANLSTMTGLSGASPESQVFPALSALARLQLGPVPIQTGIGYARKGSVFTTQEGERDATPSYVVVPVLLRYTPQWLLAGVPSIQPYGLAGLYAGVHVTGGEDFADGPSRFDTGFTVGAGVSWHMTRSRIIDFEFEYSQGFADSYSGGMSQKHQVGMLSVGFAYDLGGDQDGDGLLNREEQEACWTKAEDLDDVGTTREMDGCPDPDNDDDGVPDIEEKGWNNKQDILDGTACFGEELECTSDNDEEQRACEEKKRDHNFDTREDEDGHEDSDGCRDLDNDQDGFADARQKADDLEEFKRKKDRCPDRAYWLPFDKKPSLDIAPEEKASSDPFWAGRELGCPGNYDEYFSVAPPNIIPVPDKSIDRFEENSKELTGEHKRVLDEVARFLQHYSWIHLTIQGHSSLGEKEWVDNQRATEARLYLIEEKGIAKGRLEDEGLDNTVQLVAEYQRLRGTDPRKKIATLEKRIKRQKKKNRKLEQQLETLEKQAKRWERYDQLIRSTTSEGSDPGKNRRVTFTIDPLRQ